MRNKNANLRQQSEFKAEPVLIKSKANANLKFALATFIMVYGGIFWLADSKEQIADIFHPFKQEKQLEQQDIPATPIDEEAEELSNLEPGVYIDDLAKRNNQSMAFLKMAENAAIFKSIPSELPRRGK